MNGTLKWRLVAAFLVALMAAVPTMAADKNVTPAAQAELDAASKAVTEAESVGAPIYAKTLYDEARSRLTFAMANLNSEKRGMREDAQLNARQALRAAQAATAQARLTQSTTEARNLMADIQRFGGNVPQVTVFDPPTVPPNRGGTSAEKVQVAEAAINAAIAAGAKSTSPDDIRQAQDYLGTAKTILKAQKQSDNAEHLAYVAEMLARRAQYDALLQNPNKYLPGLRLERTRLAQAASEAQAAEERRRRENAERQAAELRQRLQAESQNRQAQADQVQALRDQLAQRDQQLQMQFEGDRQARVAAEARLNDLMARYENSLGNASTAAEAEALRRQVEDQRLSLNNVRDQETRSEAAMRAENDQLRQQLDAQRQAGTTNAQTLAQQESELQKRQAQLDQQAKERADSERRFNEMQAQRDKAIADAQSRVAQSEAQAAELRKQVEATQAELNRTKEQLSAREASDQERERMLRSLTAIAQTRMEDRGLVVTLPGIFFDTGKSALKPGAKNVLNKIADQLKGSTTAKISVEGHTDSVGSSESNMQLSQERADAVRSYLVSRGLSETMVTASGKGEESPIATNETVAGRQQNRRVELVIAQ
ncbi:MAG: OmpA family protein [Acidobacteriota bacterium]